ncbi:Ankyrin repeats (3 copies)/Ankyrin repeat, putative [Angomonas deanei]|uniref:Ankyrin repeats (3 copies)/Ankyrin repeat, putative n=1 Tax=Angomonas deanei TaxID=59799 RepID=A0A7G2CRY5_9TRYP|nr:Ankyrin repeats (3 copies)/Ankyrin repeat, putative [Angomonas deanei]
MDAIGLTPLHLAAKGNHARLFRGLLKLGGDPLFRNSKGESPIHWALEHGNDEMYKVVQDLPGFWLLSGQGELIGPMSRNEQLDDFYRCFLLQCTHPNRALRGWTKMNAFLEAVRTGNIPAVHQLALSGADLVSSDDEKWNAVHFACHFGHTAILAHIIRYVTLFYPKKMLEQLLVQSADTGNTPIHFAATKGNVGCVEILLTYPCVREQCVQARNNNGLIPANAAALSGHDDLAILLDEATGAKGRPEARDDSDKAYLEAFWGSVTEGTRRRAAEKLQELTTDQGNESEAETPPDVYVGFSQVSEESWDSQVERSIEAYLSFLPESVRPHFSAHPVLSSRVVLPFVVTNLLNIPDGAGMRAELQSTLAAVCTLDGSNGVPIFAQRFFVENILLFEPTENWSSILYSLSLTATLWSAEQYPPESHCLWEWLRLFFSKRNLGEEMAAHTYEALDTFLAFLGEDRVQLLPVPEISIGSKEVPYENNLSEALRSVNQWLREVEGSDSDLRCAIRHLNLLWRHRDVLSSQQKGDHWSIEENKAVSHYKGAHSLIAELFELR